MAGLRRITVTLFLAAAVVAVPARGHAAIKVRKPVLLAPETSRPRPAVRPRKGKDVFIGTVIFSRGGPVVAEIPGGAKPREWMVVFGQGMRRVGKAVVERELDKGVYLLKPAGRFSVSPGDRLARESEREAAARVIRTNRIPAYLEFLGFFPKSKYRARIAREVFRLKMKESYPTFPGTTLEGRLRLAETVDRDLPLGQVLIKLDRFVIARTDDTGRFRIEGIPKLPVAVKLNLDIKDPRFQKAREVKVEIPADSFAEIQADIPIRVTPTVLVGEVRDERGAPLAGMEVWTSPYTMEVLSDEAGAFRISRRKVLTPKEGEPADRPLFGGDYEVFAYRKGYSVGRARVSAESYRENRVPPIRVERIDLVGEPVPDLDLDLAQHLTLGPAEVVPQGAGPRLNP